MMPLLLGTLATSPYDKAGFYYYYVKQFASGTCWKVEIVFAANDPQRRRPCDCYDVQSDIAEQKDVSAKFPTLVAKITAMADRARNELGDNDQNGTGQRRRWIRRQSSATTAWQLSAGCKRRRWLPVKRFYAEQQTALRLAPPNVRWVWRFAYPSPVILDSASQSLRLAASAIEPLTNMPQAGLKELFSGRPDCYTCLSRQKTF